MGIGRNYYITHKNKNMIPVIFVNRGQYGFTEGELAIALGALMSKGVKKSSITVLERILDFELELKPA